MHTDNVQSVELIAVFVQHSYEKVSVVKFRCVYLGPFWG